MKQKKLLSLLLAVAMAFSLTVPAVAAEGDAAGTESGKIVILHTNDVHCGIDQAKNDAGEVTNIGYAGVAAYKTAMEAAYGAENVTLVDAGDAIQGGPIGTLSKGAYIVEIMNQVGYDLAIPGNHEFDYGMDNFLTLAREKAEYAYLCANFTDLEGKAVLDGYQVLTYGDVKVGYVGIDTPESFTKSTPTYFQDAAGNYIYSFSQGNEGKDLYDVVQKAVDAAKAEGADYVVALGHLGVDEQSSPWTSTEVIANTTGIDVLIDGHSHSTFAKTEKNQAGEDVLVAQTGTKLANLGKVVIDTKTGEITSELVAAKDCAAEDEATGAFVKGINDEFAGVLKKVVAKTDVDLTAQEVLDKLKETLGDSYGCDAQDDEDRMTNYYGLDMAQVDSWASEASSMSALDPSTAVVLKVKDGYADTAADLLRERYQQVLDYSKMYNMNVPMVEQARLFVSGNYVALLILGQTPDGDVTAEEEAQLAQDEAAKVDDAWKDIFGSAGNKINAQ